MVLSSFLLHVTAGVIDSHVILYKICYTQWYWVRQVAKSIFYAEANSAAFLNGYWDLDLNGEQLAATQGVSFSGSVAVDAALNSGSTVLYSIASGNLPAGLTFNAASGAISGTPSEVGTFTFAVDCLIDGWINKTVVNSITVAPAIVTKDGSDDFAAAQVGNEFVAEFTSNVITKDAYDTLTYAIIDGALPDGVTMDEEGTVEGTPAAAGVYTFTVELHAMKESTSKKGKTEVSETTVSIVVTMRVADENGVVPGADGE